MSKMTFVVEFEDGKEPAISSGTSILGGKLVGVSWEYALEQIEAIELQHLVDMERMGNE